MIFIFLSITYQVRADSVDIINRNKKILMGNVQITAEELIITGKRGIELKEYLLIEDSVYAKNKNTELLCDKIKYIPSVKNLHATGNLKIWENDTLKGDSLFYSRESESGSIHNNVVYLAESLQVNGNKGYFHGDSIILTEDPVFLSEQIDIKSDSIIYLRKDSTFIFLNNVTFTGESIKGSGNKLMHSTINDMSFIYDKPVIIQDRDTILGDIIKVDHLNEILKSIKGKSINYTDEGRNHVIGETLKIFYREDEVDSIIVLNKGEGKFYKNEDKSSQSR